MIKANFECQQAYYWPQFAPIVEEMLRRKKYDITLSHPADISETERHYLRSFNLTSQLSWITSESNPDRVKQIRKHNPDLVFIGNKQSFPLLKTPENRVVMVYHGIGLKQSYYRDIPKNVDHIAVESQSRMNLLRDRGFRAEQLLLTGFTKLDPLIQTPFTQRSAFLESCGFRPDIPVVLYAPTFYPSSLKAVLPHLKSTPDSQQWLVRLHQFSWTKPKYRWHVDLVRELNDHPNVCVLPPDSADILTLIQVADALVTDISSVLFEFLAVNKPIIQVNRLFPRLKHRFFPWVLRRRLDLDRMQAVDFSIPITQLPDLFPVVADQLAHPDRLERERLRAQKRYLYQIDGQASARLLDALETLMITGESHD